MIILFSFVMCLFLLSSASFIFIPSRATYQLSLFFLCVFCVHPQAWLLSSSLLQHFVNFPRFLYFYERLPPRYYFLPKYLLSFFFFNLYLRTPSYILSPLSLIHSPLTSSQSFVTYINDLCVFFHWVLSPPNKPLKSTSNPFSRFLSHLLSFLRLQ